MTKPNNKISAKISEDIDMFVDYLDLERGFSETGCASYSFDIKRFFTHLAERGEKAVDLQQPDIVAYQEYLRSQELAPGTICRHLSTIREYYHYLVSRGKIKESPTKNVRGPKMMRYSPRTLTVDEAKLLMDTVRHSPDPTPKGKRLSLRDRALLEFLYATGARVSEAIGVRRSDLFLIEKDPVVKLTGKGNKERIVPIADVAWAAIQKYLQLSRPKIAINEKSGDRLFLTRLGGSFSRMGVWKMLKKYVKIAGITKHVSPHVLRHAFATHLMIGGADLLAIQELLGHENVETTDIYTHPDIDYLISQHQQFHPREQCDISFKIVDTPKSKPAKKSIGRPIRRPTLGKKRKTWILSFHENGKRVRKSCRTGNLEKAEAIRSKTEKELFGDIIDSKACGRNPSLKKPEGERQVGTPPLSVRGSCRLKMGGSNGQTNAPHR